MKAIIIIVCVALGLSSFCHAQGTLKITFDGPPPQPPGTAVLIQHYGEAGFSFGPIGQTGFVRQGGSISFYPENGSTYLQAGLGSTLMFHYLNGPVFSLVSVDLAEYSTVVPDAAIVPFIGYRFDGSTVNISFVTDGIIDGTGPLADFETFHFGPEWSGLTRVEIPTYGWSLDNLVVFIPEPSAVALLLVGGLVFSICTRRKP
jgi:hypothetical protein